MAVLGCDGKKYKKLNPDNKKRSRGAEEHANKREQYAQIKPGEQTQGSFFGSLGPGHSCICRSRSLSLHPTFLRHDIEKSQ